MLKELFGRGPLFSLSVHENKFHTFLEINLFGANDTS